MMQRPLSHPVFVHEVQEHLQGFPITSLGGDFKDELIYAKQTTTNNDSVCEIIRRLNSLHPPFSSSLLAVAGWSPLLSY